jgi:thioredoxin-dependent peroxiredoxin
MIRTTLAGKVFRLRSHVSAKRGDELPAVALESTAGRKIHLRAEARQAHLVLFFYHAEREGLRYVELSGSTPEARAFRDMASEFAKLGARVFGVSLHATARQRSFVEREHLPFELLSDRDKALVTALGIPIWKSRADEEEEFVDRVTLVVQRRGRISHVFEDVRVDGHVGEVLDALRQLR